MEPPVESPAMGEMKKSTIDFMTLNTPDWRCDRIVDDKSAKLYCCPASTADGWSNSCIEASTAITFVGKEDEQTPPAIKVGLGVKVKCLVDRGTKVCYFPSTIPAKGEISRKLAPKKESVL